MTSTRATPPAPWSRWTERVALVTVAAVLGAALARLPDRLGPNPPAHAPSGADLERVVEPAQPTGSAPAADRHDHPDARLAAMERQLKRSREYQLELEQRIAALEQASAQPAMASGDVSPGEPGESAQSPSGRVPDELLIEAGIAADVVSALRERLAENEMAKLYLRDQAVREGWRDTPEYSQALEELNDEPQALRREFGDDVYDRYLYATGQPNRVMVSSTLAASPAEVSGIQPGDLVMRYGDQRILTLRDLRTASAAGQAGEPVSVELSRDGSSVHTTIPRGPLGVRLDLRREQP